MNCICHFFQFFIRPILRTFFCTINKTMDEENSPQTEGPSVQNDTKAEDISEVIEEDEASIEKAPPARKPRSQKQKEAFARAQAALALKRQRDKEMKAANKKPRGRPRKQKVEENDSVLQPKQSSSAAGPSRHRW